MTSHTTAAFRKALASLPESVQKQARDGYTLFQADPNHPSLRFRQVHPSKPIFSVRVGLYYRALGVRDGDSIVWFWIGSHNDYDHLV